MKDGVYWWSIHQTPSTQWTELLSCWTPVSCGQDALASFVTSTEDGPLLSWPTPPPYCTTNKVWSRETPCTCLLTLSIHSTFYSVPSPPRKMSTCLVCRRYLCRSSTWWIEKVAKWIDEDRSLLWLLSWAKWVLVMSNNFLADAHRTFDGIGVNIKTSHRLLGGVIGDRAGCESYVKDCIQK